MLDDIINNSNISTKKNSNNYSTKKRLLTKWSWLSNDILY